MSVVKTQSGSYAAADPLPQEEISRRIGDRFVEVFGPGTTVEEVQRRLERAQELRDGARKQCEKLQRWKNDGDPLVVGVFLQCLQGCVGNVTTAIERARFILAAVDEAGGILPVKKEGEE